MSYVSSKNLINELEYTPYTMIGFRLKQDREGGFNKTQYLCPFCKKIYRTNPFQKDVVLSDGSKGFQCKHCGTKLHHIVSVSGYFAMGSRRKTTPFLYQFESIKTLLIGQQYDEKDGHLKAVNATVFYQNHAVTVKTDSCGQKPVYSSYVRKERIILNLDMNQIYYIHTPASESVPEFEHFTLQYATFQSDTTLFSILYRKLIEIVYQQGFGYPLVSHLKVLERMTATQVFYLMKFPVVSSYAYYQGLQDVTCNMFELFYWLSNDDRKLRPMIICRNFDTYESLWSSYLADTFSICESDVSRKYSPWFFLAAWQLGHMGFRKKSSVEQVTQEVLETKLVGNSSVFLYTVFMKRQHSWNKLMRRLIKIHGEDAVIQMLLHSNRTCNYKDYVCQYKRYMERILLQLDFHQEDFSKSLDAIIF